MLAHDGSVEFRLRGNRGDPDRGGSSSGDHVDRLTDAATDGLDDPGDADASKDTDREPEGHAPSAYYGTT